VLLLARAKLLAREKPDAEVLVLCYNVALASYLRASLADFANARVHHFDGWAKHNGIVRKRATETETDENDASLGNRLKAVLEAGKGESRRFAAVLIDEAQDFDSTWFGCVLEAMQDPNDGDLLIVGDRHQGIRGPRSVVWSSVGISARGRSISAKFDLDKNYRNSKEILELAASFAREQGNTEDEDHFGVVPVDPAKALRSTGILPVLMRSESRAAECRAVVRVVQRLLGQLAPGDIGILYRRLLKWDEKAFEEFRNALSAVAPLIWVNDPHSDNRSRIGEPGIKLQTIHSSKGLQYKAVILLWADLLPSTHPEADRAEETKLMYVALTRPEDYLFVSYSGSSEFTETIRNTGKVSEE